MRLLVIRHGETDYNAQHLLTGQNDIPLNNRGEQQALAVGRYLASETLDVILSSDLQRARATARAVAQHHSLTVIGDSRLRELSMGRWEGKTKEMVREQFPEEYQLWQEDALTHAPTGGETIQQLRDRLASTLVDCFERYQDRTVVWVAHGGVMGVLVCHLLELHLARRRQFQHDNASLTEFRISPSRVTLVRLNETAFWGPYSS